jgi:DNA adenine methylase
MKPFVNYIGSKQRFMKRIEDLFPETIRDYYEPFLGGGSVFLRLLNRIKGKVYINDLNQDLAGCWRVVRDDIEKLLKKLGELNRHRDRTYYFFVKTGFNERSEGEIERAAMLIYLLKLSYNNRLNYSKRDNSTIKPNYSPMHAKSPIYDEGNLRAVSEALQGVSISGMNYEEMFESCLAAAGCNFPQEGDFVFLDPPYLVEQVQSYYQNTFSLNDYKRLLKIYDELNRRRVKWLLTVGENKDIRELFKDYKITSIQKSSNISSGRGQEYELVVRNYE